MMHAIVLSVVMLNVVAWYVRVSVWKYGVHLWFRKTAIFTDKSESKSCSFGPTLSYPVFSSSKTMRHKTLQGE
jgi:hypothetical protein